MRRLHQQHELNEAPSLSFKYATNNNKNPLNFLLQLFCNSFHKIKKDRMTILNSAIGEALASTLALNTNRGEPGNGTLRVAKKANEKIAHFFLRITIFLLDCVL